MLLYPTLRTIAHDDLYVKLEQRFWAPCNVFSISLLGNMESAARSVLNAMKQWERKTCLRFVSRTNEKAYMEFFKDQG